MTLLIFWLMFAFVVGAAASARGRSGAGWFILSAIISPLLGLILVLVLPNLRHEALLEKLNVREQPPHKSIGGTASRVAVDRSPRPFEPDGVYAGFPYRVVDDGSIEAIMQGVLVRFRDFDKFTGAIGPV
jgi:hypothetical protein